MQNQIYKSLSDKDKKLYVIRHLIKQSENKLTKKIINKIISYVRSSYGEFKRLIDTQPFIVVTSSESEFEYQTTLITKRYKAKNGVYEYFYRMGGECVLGDMQFGCIQFLDDEIELTSRGRFDNGQVNVALVKYIEYPNGVKEDRFSRWRVVIFLPTTAICRNMPMTELELCREFNIPIVKKSIT